MSYNEYTWQTGETITAEKLNNLEEGVQEALAGDGNEKFVVTFTHNGDSVSADKTIAEISEAYNSGKEVIGTTNADGFGVAYFPLTEFINGFQATFTRVSCGSSNIIIKAYTINLFVGVTYKTVDLN